MIPLWAERDHVKYVLSLGEILGSSSQYNIQAEIGFQKLQKFLGGKIAGMLIHFFVKRQGFEPALAQNWCSIHQQAQILWQSYIMQCPVNFQG